MRSCLAAAALLVLAGVPSGARAQDGAAGQIRVVKPSGEVLELGAREHRGYAVVPASSLEALGWELDADAGAWRLRDGSGVEVHLVPEDPFFRWEGEVRQLVDPPYVHDGRVWVPAQLVLDFLPFRLPDRYRYRPGEDGPELHLVSGEAGADSVAAVQAGGGAHPWGRASASRTAAEEARVVVIDPGHGGRDLGAVGPGGSREKDVVLAVGRALSRRLERYPGLEVHMTRDSDVLIPLWRRGEWATERKGERSGIFISLHANAMASRAERGFETYFLSEARTEHERRVAAIENAAPEEARDGNGNGHDDGLGFILNELRNDDHQHWSAALADLVQARLGTIHPGPDRGVKQGPFAVITNALMPAVLVEVGFMSNREEERLLGRAAFHEDLAGALAEAVVDFFRRYPPGRGTDLEAARPRGSPP